MNFPATANSDSMRMPGGARARFGWIFAVQGYAPLYQPATKNKADKLNKAVVTKKVWKYPFSSSELPHDGAFPRAGFPKINPTKITIQIDIAIPKVTL